MTTAKPKAWEWNDKTKAVLEGQPEWVTEALTAGLMLRAQCRALEDQAKALKKEANEMLMPAFAFADAKVAGSDTFGTIRYKQGSSSRLDKEALSDFLVKEGVKVALVGDALAHATRVSTYETVEFRLPKN